jgi:hypothetical protein
VARIQVIGQQVVAWIAAGAARRARLSGSTVLRRRALSGRGFSTSPSSYAVEAGDTLFLSSLRPWINARAAARS